MPTRKIKASLLVKDFSLYPRAQVDPYHVNAMAESLRAEHTLPPILVDKESLRIVDGFHRVTAWQKVYGLDVEVEAVLKAYTSDAAIFAEAMTLNSIHGRTLTTFDKVRCLTLGEQYGLTRDTIATSLHITRTKADNLVLTRVSATGLPLKRTTEHLAGQDMTQDQQDYNKNAAGPHQMFLINQVIQMIESKSVDLDKPQVVKALQRLHALLEGMLMAKQA